MSCGGDDETKPLTPNSNDPPDDMMMDMPQEGEPVESGEPLTSDDSDVVFDFPGVPIFQLTLPEGDWEALQANATLEEYVAASLVFEGMEMGEVGLRFKGGYGSFRNCIDASNMLTCDKLSMKVKFSEYDKDKRFYGMKRLNFHSMIRDQSKIAEKLGYKLYREMGVPAPRSHWARLEINGQSFGLFSLVEQIDGRFTDFHFPEDGDGNLYKEAWVLSESNAYFTERLKTNEEMPDHTSILGFASELTAGSSPAEYADVLEKWTDTEELLAYMAVDDALNNWDGITAWYCFGSCFPHNFYWYAHQNKQKFSLIPWDLDNTAMSFTPVAHIPHWRTKPDDCAETYQVSWGDQLAAPGCDPFFQGLATDGAGYVTQVQRLLDEHLVVEQVSAEIDSYAALIRDEIVADPTGVDEVSWANSVATLKNYLTVMRARLESLRDEAQ